MIAKNSLELLELLELHQLSIVWSTDPSTILVHLCRSSASGIISIYTDGQGIRAFEGVEVNHAAKIK